MLTWFVILNVKTCNNMKVILFSGHTLLTKRGCLTLPCWILVCSFVVVTNSR